MTLLVLTGSARIVAGTLAAVLSVLLVSSAFPAHAAPNVQATPSASTVEMGQRVDFTGSVTPAKAGVTVVAQVKIGNRWRPLKTGRTGPGGTFSLSVLPTDAGHYLYRVTSKKRSRTTGSSAPFVITGLMWHYLKDVQPVSGNPQFYEARINGKEFSRTLTFYWQNLSFIRYFNAEYDLRRECTRLQGTAGLTDNSASGTTMPIRVIADGVTLFDQTFGLGQSTDLDLNVADHLRLRLESGGSIGTGFAALGDVRILCAFGP